MAEFFASTARGLVEPLEQELKDLGLKVLGKTAGGVYFESNWEGCYKANLCSRLASRILKPIMDFTAYQPEELYNQILRHDFTKYINPNQTISIDVSVGESKMRDQRFIAMKIKDAIVDQFRDKFGVRPDVDNYNPALRIVVRCVKNQFNVSVDTTGDSLFMRGYRKEVGEAPMKENLAAGLVKLSEWDGKSPIVDFMCGSGTFLIEAAMMAKNIAPGINRKRFGFMNLLNYEKASFENVVQEALDAEKEEIDFKFYGFDIDNKVLKSAKENAREAGVDDVIEFKKESVATVEPPVEKGLIIVNPPYGARIGDEDNLRDVYRDLGFTLKHRFKGWDAWILSGNKDLIADLKLKSTRKHFVFNGNIECRFLKYSMF
ncbi:MAG: RNA methyltransferase [Bdellovibrio sp.]|nr:RNA methyltransferase [Bdellovibrio sp.]